MILPCHLGISECMKTQAVGTNIDVKIQKNTVLCISLLYDSSGQIEIANGPLKESNLLFS
jgi:hypothetical protein